MELKYYLEQLSSSTLKQIIAEHGIKDIGNSPNELVNILLKRLSRKEKLSKLYQLMSFEEREVLSYFIVQNPNRYIFYRRLDKITAQISRDQFELGINKLRRKGIIFALRKSWGEIAFTIPENLSHLWHSYFFHEVIGKESSVENNSMLVQSTNSLLEEDLFRFLAYFHSEEVSMTSKEIINKKYLDRISELILIDEEIIKRFPIAQEDNDNYPSKVNLLLNIAKRLDLIEIDRMNTTRKSLVWHQLDFKNQRKYLEAILRLEFQSTDLLLQHMFHLLFHLSKGNWFSFKVLFTSLARKLNRPVDDELLRRAEYEILLPLHAFGWVKLIEASEGSYYFRIILEEETIDHIYVQPNYEILVPQSFPYQHRLIIEQFANSQYQDKICKYLLTKESVIKGLEAGRSIESFISFLESFSAIPVGENIKKTLIDWSKNYGTIAFLDVRIMKCNSVKLAMEIKLHKTLQAWIIGEISPKNLIINREGFDHFIVQLNKQGYYPAKEIWFGEIRESDEDDVDFDESLELIRDREYQIENQFPSINLIIQ